MSAVTRLKAAGFTVRFVPPNSIGITPIERLTDIQRQWIKSNRSLLLAELTGANEPDRWQHFIDLCAGQGVNTAEVERMFHQQDKADVLEAVPDSELPLHAKTIADAIKRKRKPVVIVLDTRKRYVINGPVTHRCGDCQHFRRIEHPHLGTCDAGEPEGIAGNWDTDNRNYCQSFTAGTDTTR